jgi:hypothetical protein
MSKTFENSEMFVDIGGDLTTHVFLCIARCPESAPPEAPNPRVSTLYTSLYLCTMPAAPQRTLSPGSPGRVSTLIPLVPLTRCPSLTDTLPSCMYTVSRHPHIYVELCRYAATNSLRSLRRCCALIITNSDMSL